jgi:hypothetical protein
MIFCASSWTRSNVSRKLKSESSICADCNRCGSGFTPKLLNDLPSTLISPGPFSLARSEKTAEPGVAFSSLRLNDLNIKLPARRAQEVMAVAGCTWRFSPMVG